MTVKAYLEAHLGFRYDFPPSCCCCPYWLGPSLLICLCIWNQVPQLPKEMRKLLLTLFFWCMNNCLKRRGLKHSPLWFYKKVGAHVYIDTHIVICCSFIYIYIVICSWICCSFQIKMLCYCLPVSFVLLPSFLRRQIKEEK